MMYLHSRWIVSNNIGFKDGCREPTLVSSEKPLIGGLQMSNTRKLIAVVGATGQQGGAVVRALQAQGQFNVRALTRNPEKHRKIADEVVEADLNRPETLTGAFKGAYGVFLV